MAGVNQKGQMPIGPPAIGKPMRRSLMLDGTVHTFFGPYQRPDAVNVYHNPTAWPKAGSLLYVPQVVWLTSYFNSLGGTTSGTISVSSSLGGSVTVPNHYMVEMLRVASLYATAKAAIEAVRPDRTYVYVVPWYNSDYLSFPFLFDGASMNLLQASTPAADAEFFGTDFLHICAGHMGAWDGSTYEASNTALFASRSGGSMTNTSSVATWLTRNTFTNAQACLAGSYAKFRRYAARIYAHEIDWSDWPTDAKEDAFGHPTAFYTALQANTPANQAVIAAIASNLAGFGITNPGNSESLSSASVVSMIADHFGFDPSTGRDL